MTTECEYADGFVVLTASKLVVLLSAPELNAVHHFKGCSFKDELNVQKYEPVRAFFSCRD